MRCHCSPYRQDPGSLHQLDHVPGAAIRAPRADANAAAHQEKLLFAIAIADALAMRAMSRAPPSSGSGGRIRSAAPYLPVNAFARSGSSENTLTRSQRSSSSNHSIDRP